MQHLFIFFMDLSQLFDSIIYKFMILLQANIFLVIEFLNKLYSILNLMEYKMAKIFI